VEPNCELEKSILCTAYANKAVNSLDNALASFAGQHINFLQVLCRESMGTNDAFDDFLIVGLVVV